MTADRAKHQAEKIAIKLRDCIDECVDDAILISMLHNSNIDDYNALKQASLDVADMLDYYTNQLRQKYERIEK